MKKGDCVLCKHEIPRSDNTTAHSDQDFHCLSMHFTVTSVSLGTTRTIKDADSSARILSSLSQWSFTNVDVHLMLAPLCFY